MEELRKNIIDADNFMQLLNKSRKLEKLLKENSGEYGNNIKIAVLSSFSIQHIVSVLRFMLFQKGINSEIYEGDYNSITSSILNNESDLYSFNPELIILLPHYTDIKQFPSEFDDINNVNNLVNNIADFYKNLWNEISKKLNCHILQSNFVIPIERKLGNLEYNYIFSRQSFYQMINLKLIEKRNNNVNLVDIDYIASLIGKENWFDNSGYFLSKLSFKLKYIGRYVDCFVKQIEAIKGKIKKCIVLDLDNTLWGGVVGDLGYKSINVDPNNPIGESYLWFQKYLLLLKERGVILAVCSKNDENIAKSPFIKNENMILKLEDFSVFYANWEDKATNICNIANELNIGLDTIVFFDDNPAEREIVKQCLESVYVLDVPADSAEYVNALNKANLFEWLQITNEDIVRSDTYINDLKRKELCKTIINYDEYLKSLEMCGKIIDIDKCTLSRFAQLINKTNQFNLRTIRYTESNILKFIEDDDYKCISISLKDKFSDYGIISGVILKKIDDNYCFIDTWIMSCRVLKRGIEYLMIEKIISVAKGMGCKFVLGEYIETTKNKMVSNLYMELGFKKYIDNDIDVKTDNLYKLNIYEIDKLFSYYIEEK